jgi:hypothetical protein
LPVLSLQDYSQSIQSHGIVNYIRSPYVYVQNGHFYKDGKRLTLIGPNLFANQSYPFDPQWDYNNLEEDIDAIASWGANYIHLLFKLTYLDPNYGGPLNRTHLAELDKFIQLAAERGMYIGLKMYFPGGATTAGNPPFPDWLVSEDRCFNSSTLNEVVRIWGILADRYKNEEYLLGYYVPFNEPEPLQNTSSYNHIAYMTGDDNVTVKWNNWLRKRFGSIEELNATWNANTISQLDSSEKEWGKVKLPISLRMGSNQANDYRLPEWSIFVSEFEYNYTLDIINEIRKYDTNHILIYDSWNLHRESSNPSMKNKVALDKYLPNQCDAVEIHSYPSSSSQTVNRMAFGLFPSLAFASINQSKAVVLGETSHAQLGGVLYDPYPWADDLYAQAYWWGVDLLSPHLYARWGNSHAMADRNREILDRCATFKEWTSVFKAGTPERNITIGVIGFPKFDNYYRILASLLATNGHRWAYLSRFVGDEEPEVLNRFGALIVSTYGGSEYWRLSDATLRAIREYAENGKGKVLLIGTHPHQNPHGKARTASTVGWDHWILKQFRYENWASEGIHAIKFQNDFGNIDVGTSFNLSVRAAGTLYPNYIVGKKLANCSIDGTEYVVLAKNETGNVVLFFDIMNMQVPDQVDEGLTKVFHAFLNWTGHESQDGYSEVLQWSNLTKGYALFFETYGKTGTYEVQIQDADTSKIYVVYELNAHINISYPYSIPRYISEVDGATLRNGWNINISSSHARLFRIIDKNKPAYVISFGTSSESSHWIPSNQTLQMHFRSVRNSLGFVKAYWQNMGFSVKIKFDNGTIVNAENYWNNETRLVTFPISFYDDSIVVSIYGTV